MKAALGIYITRIVSSFLYFLSKKIRITDSVAVAQREVDSLMDWASSNAVKFEPLKMEVLHLHGCWREEVIDILSMKKHGVRRLSAWPLI